jgi:two-component system chemotaxis response regulator CheB
VMHHYEAIVIGSSAGGLPALLNLFKNLPVDFPLPIIIVQHLLDGNDSYLAPPGYHLLIEDDHTLSLSMDPRVNFSRPSIDVLFESAAFVYEERCIGIILTGASSDGSQGLKKIKAKGGLTLVQDPKNAEFSEMPMAAINALEVDHICTIEEISDFMKSIVGGSS